MPLRLIAGPANAGKVELLLGRYLGTPSTTREPLLIVPNRADVDRVERKLLERGRRSWAARSVPSTTSSRSSPRGARTHAESWGARADAARPSRRERRRPARLRCLRAPPGFADSLQQALDELESGLLDPAAVDGELGALYAVYREELDRIGRWDLGLLRRSAVERLHSDLDAWHGQPVFAYGFEDLTGAEWALVEALAARTEVTVSLPYEPGRPAFEALHRTAEDLAGLAVGAIEELPPRYAAVAPPALAHLERALFSDEPGDSPPIDGAVRSFEARAAAAPSSSSARKCSRSPEPGRRPSGSGWWCRARPGARRARDGARLVRHPVCRRRRDPAHADPLVHALAALLRFAWGGGPDDLFRFLRSPFSGLERRSSTSSRDGCAGVRCRRRSV